MTKKLEDLLNLPDSKQIVEESRKEKKETAIVEQEDTMRSIQELDKIQAALPQVKGLGDLGDTELDEVATKSMDAYEDLMDLYMIQLSPRQLLEVEEIPESLLDSLKNILNESLHFEPEK